MAEVADALGISRNLLFKWKREVGSSGATAFPGNGNLNAVDEKLRRLRRDMSIAVQERDISRRAVTFFAKPKN